VPEDDADAWSHPNFDARGAERDYLGPDGTNDPGDAKGGHLRYALAISVNADGYLALLDPLVVESLGRRETRLSALTRRQLEVLSLMAKGYNNAAIARSLVLEEKSVENHINAIFGQLNLSRDNAAHPRVKAVLLYLQETLGTAADSDEQPVEARPRKAA